MKRYYIFAGGNIDPDVVHEFMKADSNDKVKIIAADSGLNALHAMGIRPDFLLGDFDSVDEEILNLYLEDRRILCESYPSHKDFTDMELAMKLALRDDPDDIVIFGATGTRIDHMLGNIGVLNIALKSLVRARIVDANNVIEMISPGIHTLERDKMYGKYVSLLPYTKKVKNVMLKGFVYDVQDATFERGSSLGISNELKADEASIYFTKGTFILIQSRD